MASRPVAAPQADDGTDRGGVRLALVLLGAAAAASFVGFAPVVAYALLLAVVGVALALAGRRSTAYVEFLLWVWLLTPGLRRIVDLHVGWTPLSPVMLAAPLASLAAVPAILRGRRLVHRDAQAAFLVTLVALAYGVVVGVVRGSSVAAPLAALLTWAPPIVSGLYVATIGPSKDAMAKLLARAWPSGPPWCSAATRSSSGSACPSGTGSGSSTRRWPRSAGPSRWRCGSSARSTPRVRSPPSSPPSSSSSWGRAAASGCRPPSSPCWPSASPSCARRGWGSR